MTVRDRFGAQYTIRGEVDTAQGRDTVIKTDGIIEDKVVTNVRTIGADGPTRAEQQKVLAVLEILQNESRVFEGPFLRTIFPDGKGSEVDWPEDMPVLEKTPPITFPHSTLNDSQEKAVLAMLSLTNSTRLTLIQGPPGTGKTTVSTQNYCSE